MTGTQSSTLATTTINITAVNDAPVISNVSGSVSTNQNTPVTLNASTGTVTDVDAAPSDLLLATLSVAHGTLAPIGNVPGLTIVNGQDGSAGVLSFTGTQAALTQAIETGVSYTPALNLTGLTRSPSRSTTRGILVPSRPRRPPRSALRYRSIRRR